MESTFTKSDKIRKSGEFFFIKKTGSVFKTKLLVFNYSPSNRMKLGVIVTKKVGNAVFRNKVKRWLREIFRNNRDKFVIPLNLVIIPRQSRLTFDELKRDFLYFSVKCNGNNTDSAG